MKPGYYWVKTKENTTEWRVLELLNFGGDSRGWDTGQDTYIPFEDVIEIGQYLGQSPQETNSIAIGLNTEETSIKLSHWPAPGVDEKELKKYF